MQWARLEQQITGKLVMVNRKLKEAEERELSEFELYQVRGELDKSIRIVEGYAEGDPVVNDLLVTLLQVRRKLRLLIERRKENDGA